MADYERWLAANAGRDTGQNPGPDYGVETGTNFGSSSNRGDGGSIYHSPYRSKMNIVPRIGDITHVPPIVRPTTPIYYPNTIMQSCPICHGDNSKQINEIYEGKLYTRTCLDCNSMVFWRNPRGDYPNYGY